MRIKYYLFFILNLLTAVSYYYIDVFLTNIIPKNYFSVITLLWNTVLGLIFALIFINKDFISQLKSFSIKWFILGLSLTSFVAYLMNYFYTHYISTPSVNILANKQIETLLMILPILALGEEIISTNLTTALKKIGINFWIATFLISIMFALWHIRAFGFVPLQLITILAPIRIALNYVWKESNSIFTAALVHYVFNVLVFTIFY